MGRASSESLGLSGRACSVCGVLACDTVAARSRRPRSSRRSTPHTQSSGRSRKARTPTTFRRSPRSIRPVRNRRGHTDGKVYTAGDVKTEVSIQSISKVFTMAQVIQEQGRNRSRSGSASMPPAHGSTRSSRLKASGPSSAPGRRR